jgi:hypothetical protein
MAYRDWLVQLSPTSADYISQLCRKRYAEMEREMLALYQLAHEVGTTEFLRALELAHDQQTFGAEYVQALLVQPVARPHLQHNRAASLEAVLQRPEPAFERELMQYEQYVANRRLLVGGDEQ